MDVKRELIKYNAKCAIFIGLAIVFFIIYVLTKNTGVFGAFWAFTIVGVSEFKRGFEAVKNAKFYDFARNENDERKKLIKHKAAYITFWINFWFLFIGVLFIEINPIANLTIHNVIMIMLYSMLGTYLLSKFYYSYKY